MSSYQKSDQPNSDERIILSPFCKLTYVTPENKSFWFGYYNYSPISRDGCKMLAHRVCFEGRMPNADDSCEIGYFDLSDGSWHHIWTTNAFNWQQGSMLQWLGPDFNSRVIFNYAENGKFLSKIISINSGEIETIPDAIYAMDPNGTFSITINFERCFWTRAYSYATIQNPFWNKNIPDDDGIYRIDLQTKEKIKIIDLKDIIMTNGGKYDDLTAHWLEHIQINPSGTRIAFYHRFGSVSNYTTHLYTAGVGGDNMWLHPFDSGSQISHLGWRKTDQYVVFTKMESKTGIVYSSLVKKRSKLSRVAVFLYRKFVKPFLSIKRIATIAENSGYALTTDQSGIKEKWNFGKLCLDGHPSFTRDGNFMLTDTYSDEHGYRHLLLYDISQKKLIILANVFSSINDVGWRADLHPRFSPDENKVIVDSTHNGYHQMIVFELDWSKIKKNV